MASRDVLRASPDTYLAKDYQLNRLEHLLLMERRSYLTTIAFYYPLAVHPPLYPSGLGALIPILPLCLSGESHSYLPTPVNLLCAMLGILPQLRPLNHVSRIPDNLSLVETEPLALEIEGEVAPVDFTIDKQEQ